MISVLVVDDNITDLQAICALLDSNDDIVAHFTHEPLNTVKLAKKIKPDIILLDMMMPAAIGLDVRKMLLSDTQTQMIPVIFLTADYSAVTEYESRKIGCLDYIKKPANKSELLTRIRQNQAFKAIKNAIEIVKNARVEVA